MSEIETLKKELVECKKKSEEYLNGWKQAKADYINFQKQVEKEKAEWLLFSNASFIQEILPVLDSLEKGAEQEEGIKSILNQMKDILQKMGVKLIKTIGEPVNPEVHEVVGKEKSEDVASGLITKEVQQGYTLYGKVLRIAKVIVSE